jgi:oligopeptide transport system substrate-binding protein
LKKLAIVPIIIFLLFVTLAGGCGLFQSDGGNGTYTLNLVDSDPTTLDPAVSSEVTSSQYILEIFSGLLRLDDKMQPAPDIAASMPSVSSDGLTYTFKLRQDVKFSDGHAVTAADFKYSWERAANPATNSQTASSYLGDIVGVNEELAGKSNQISGVQVVDNYTLKITIDSPKSYFMYKLAYPTTFVVEKSNVNSGADWWHNPVGSGPFKLGQWTQNQSLNLVRNDSYYGTKPQLGQVKYQFYSGLPMDLYETGKVDVTRVSTDYKDAVTDKSGQYYKDLTVSPTLGIFYIGFNCSQPPFDDINVRKAFSLAIDKDKIISLVFKDMQQKANGILPPGMPGYNASVTGLGFNVNQARDLLKASKYGDAAKLPPITLTTYGYGGGINTTLQAMVFQWKQNLGVDVKVRQLEPERYFYNTKMEIDQLFETGWNADYPHPQDFVDILFRSGSAYNYGNYLNIDADSLINQANRTLDSAQSISLYQQAEQIIVNDAACIPISFQESYTLIKPYVKGYTVNPLGFGTLDKVTILSH